MDSLPLLPKKRRYLIDTFSYLHIQRYLAVKLRCLLALLLAFVSHAYAQYPVQTGTVWEYIQQDDLQNPTTDIAAFKDSIVADTLIEGEWYHKVQRRGSLSTWVFEYPNGLSQTDISGTYFFREQQDTVWAISRWIADLPERRILYDFTLRPGDTVSYPPLNLIDLTWPGSDYDYAAFCELAPDFCRVQTILVDTINPDLPFGDYTFSNTSFAAYIRWKVGVGTTYSNPFIIRLGLEGQHYILKRLETPERLLYHKDGIPEPPLKPDLSEDIRLYPNPVGEVLHFYVRGIRRGAALVRDAQGQIRSEVRWEGDQPRVLPTQDLPAGIYWLEVQSGTSRGFRMFWKR